MVNSCYRKIVNGRVGWMFKLSIAHDFIVFLDFLSAGRKGKENVSFYYEINFKKKVVFRLFCSCF